jgi:2-succinyl-5-enolpyruvyl-6-hydroxy-3-cyclohexene-1-carboxylate synthase
MIQTVWKRKHRKIIVVGQSEPQTELSKVLATLQVPVITDVIANTFGGENFITQQDVFLSSPNTDELVPDLLITFGGSLISKNLKLFLRKNNIPHWHIQPFGEVADTFQSLEKIVRLTPLSFFKLLENITSSEKQIQFNNLWLEKDKKTIQIKKQYFNQFTKQAHQKVEATSESISEFEAVYCVLNSVLPDMVVHLANSMSVRYANFCGIEATKNCQVFANRGTSGIDGSSSTAVGHSIIKRDKLHLLITGDVAFFYDRNAFWNKYVGENIRILLLNNGGGGIFGIIEGSSDLPELKEYFETEQPLTAQKTAEDFGFDYLTVRNITELSAILPQYWQKTGKPKILEVLTNKANNKAVLKAYLKTVRENL